MGKGVPPMNEVKIPKKDFWRLCGRCKLYKMRKEGETMTEEMKEFKKRISAVDFRKLVRASFPRARLKSLSEEEIKEIIEKIPKDWGVKTKSSEI